MHVKWTLNTGPRHRAWIEAQRGGTKGSEWAGQCSKERAYMCVYVGSRIRRGLGPVAM